MEQRNVDCVVHDNLGLAVKISLLYNLGLAIKISLLFICKNLPDNLHLGCWDGCWAWLSVVSASRAVLENQFGFSVFGPIMPAHGEECSWNEEGRGRKKEQEEEGEGMLVILVISVLCDALARCQGLDCMLF